MTKSASKLSASLTSVIERSNNKLWGFHAVVPKKTAEKFIDGNNRRVVCTFNKTETFQAALLSVGNGDFLITVNKQLREKLKLNEGDEILVELKKDTSEFGLPVPEEFVELLAQDDQGNRHFMDLTDGKKRTLLYIIGKPKASDLKIRNGVVILNHLKQQHGKIDYKQLNLELKNAH